MADNPAISTGLKGAAKVANGTAVAVDKSAMEKPRKRGRGRDGKRGYQAASQTGAQQLWMGTRGDANYDLQLGLESLRAKSRDAYQNEAYAHDIIDTYAYRVGLVNQDFSYSTAIGLFKNVTGMALMLTVNALSRRMDGKGV